MTEQERAELQRCVNRFYSLRYGERPEPPTTGRQLLAQALLDVEINTAPERDRYAEMCEMLTGTTDLHRGVTVITPKPASPVPEWLSDDAGRGMRLFYCDDVRNRGARYGDRWFDGVTLRCLGPTGWHKCELPRAFLDVSPLASIWNFDGITSPPAPEPKPDPVGDFIARRIAKREKLRAEVFDRQMEDNRERFERHAEALGRAMSVPSLHEITVSEGILPFRGYRPCAS